MSIIFVNLESVGIWSQQLRRPMAVVAVVPSTAVEIRDLMSLSAGSVVSPVCTYA
ncbi:hypothetical protein ABZX40_08165 [Streptomyces sp. NPDC004610]|uniref:hypothetical protein n=1 Tax=unclassified Streptomyces TaxID=2593676 RepID=UPI0033B49AE7